MEVSAGLPSPDCHTTIHLISSSVKCSFSERCPKIEKTPQQTAGQVREAVRQARATLVRPSLYHLRMERPPRYIRVCPPSEVLSFAMLRYTAPVCATSYLPWTALTGAPFSL